MPWMSRQRIAFGVICGLAGAGLSTQASAQDFFSALFGSLLGGTPASRPSLSIPSPFGTAPEARPAPAARAGGGGRIAYCVRSCDGRYFPVQGSDSESRVAACSSFCPAGEAKVFYGSSIDEASTEAGKSYSELPNAFRYRNELVPGCTCNGKDPTGLAAISIDEDRTLRRGDIVAGPNGLMVASGRSDAGTAMNFTPAPLSVRAKFDRHAKFERLRLVARE